MSLRSLLKGELVVVPNVGPPAQHRGPAGVQRGPRRVPRRRGSPRTRPRRPTPATRPGPSRGRRPARGPARGAARGLTGPPHPGRCARVRAACHARATCAGVSGSPEVGTVGSACVVSAVSSISRGGGRCRRRRAHGGHDGDRGPDGGGLWAQGPMALGHRRLKIIDLSERAAQPMVDADARPDRSSSTGASTTTTSCARELEATGYRFFSTGDTEVVLKAYAHWGDDFVDHLVGMFAFAIVERDTGRVVLARDRLGIKPLYLAEVGGRAALRVAPCRRCSPAAASTPPSTRSRSHHYLTLPRRRAGAPHHPARRPQAARRRRCWSSSPTAAATSAPTGAPTFSRRPEHGRLVRPRLAGRPAGVAAHRRRAADGRRRAGRRACSPAASTPASSSACWPRQGQRDLLTFSIGFESRRRHRGRRVPLLRRGRRALRHRPPPASASRRDRLAAGARRRRRGHERADGQPRRRGLLPAVAGGGASTSRWCSRARAPTRCSPATTGTRRCSSRARPPTAASTPTPGRSSTATDDGDGRGRRRRAPLPRTTRRGTFVAAHFARPARDDADRPGAAHRHRGHAGRRPGEAGRQHDDGVRASRPGCRSSTTSSSSWPPPARPSSRWPRAARACSRRPARRVIPAEVIDRPKGYFPVPGAHPPGGPLPRHGARRAHRARRPSSGACSNRRYVDALLADPNGELTPLRGNKLWQLGLLEMWLQSHGIAP